jgi:uncharacterized protein involved in exopolysaccharide biosynthesis
MDNETNINNSGQEDEISLLDLFAVLLQWKKMIIIITTLAVIGVVIYAIISIKLPPEKSPMPNQFTPKALMLIDNKSSSGGGLSSMINASGMGGLASLAGVTIPGSATNSKLAIFLIGTNSLLDAVVDEFKLIDRYKIKSSPRGNSRKALRKNLKADSDDKSGVITISFTDTDPVFARDVVNYCVSNLEKRFDELGLDKNKREKENLELNLAATLLDIQGLEEESRRLEQSVTSFSGRLPAITRDINRITMELTAKRQVYTQLRVQYELLKLAEVPDMKSGPSRGMLCVIVTFAAGFFSIFLAFVLNAIANIKKDPEAIAKLRGKSEK